MYGRVKKIKIKLEENLINIKPDDCADLAWGCNKTCNLEFWAVNTIAKGADT